MMSSRRFSHQEKNLSGFVLQAAGICIVLMFLIVIAMWYVDMPIARWARAQDFSLVTDLLFRFVRLPGNYLFTVLLAGWLISRSRMHWFDVVVMLSAGAIASGLAGALKLLFGRVRPSQRIVSFEWSPMHSDVAAEVSFKHLSFPSGDATLAFATAVVIAMSLPRVRLLAFIWAIGVCCVRVLQGVHYPSDVMAGAVVGISAAVLTIVVSASLIQRIEPLATVNEFTKP